MAGTGAERGRAPHGGLSPRSFGAMILLAILWGLSIPVTKLGLETLPPLMLTALRFAVAVPLLFALILRRVRLPWRAVPPVAALGIVGISVGQVAQALGVQDTTASVGTIVTATIPVFVVVIAAFRLKQAVSARQTVALLAAFAGIALVALGGGPRPGTAAGSSLAGTAWLLLSALAVAVYYVWSVELTEAHGTTTVAAWSTAFGFAATLPFAAWEAWHVPFRVTAQSLWVGAYLGIAVTVVGLFLWLHLLRIVPARVAASVQYLQPVVGILAASALFGDPLGPTFWLGVALIGGGLVLAVASRRAPEAPVPQG